MMDHVAIMNPLLGLIDKILSGEKIIESRWYKNKISPWNKVNIGDNIYFKNSGKEVRAMAIVNKVKQFDNLDTKLIGEIVNKYGKKICLQNWDYERWGKGKKYCILIWLIKPKSIKTFKISKAGFGNGVAWMCVEDINRVKL